ncbi:MAG: hypothetical protein NTW08_07305 [Gammaproteobacteria bacterium]|nr:hypothetical protein [Gammaproteobacteria bacterium]
MTPLILHPTDLCQWHALLGEAQMTSHVVLSENTESYLVFLLMRFAKEHALSESILALDFLESEQGTPTQQRIDKLQEIGDKSLLFCGLFPGMANKRHVSLSYFSEMGQHAYFSVSRDFSHPHALLFAELSERFLSLQQVLQRLAK